MIRRGILKCLKILILNLQYAMIATKVNSDLSGYII